MTADNTYRIADRVPGHPFSLPVRIRAQATGEFRPPRKGEWYLSGAIIAAYRARADLDTPYHIARLVKVEHVEMILVIGEFLPPPTDSRSM